ncbi:hypothetical protein [Kordia sp.]|uniref:hypothetical protein n=1 Tax=Kordia sp. TaxID=1965332 RepID=UPI003D6AACA7
MPQIRIYQFRPESKPPSKVHKMYSWFKTEVSNASIEPLTTYEIPESGAIDGNDTQLSLATKLYKGYIYLKKAFSWFKQRS